METGDSAAKAGAGDFARDWEALRAASDIQFVPVKPPAPNPPPEWLQSFFKWLGELLQPLGDLLANVFGAIGRFLGVSGQVIMWSVLALAALLILYLLWRTFAPMLANARPGGANESVPEWTPDADQALALLEDADRLAAEGRFEEATHLLLKRSVGQIAEARPGLLEPSSTAREIAELPDLSHGARSAFGVIAERVERSLFALRNLSAEDWQAARAAYAEFALAAPRLGVVAG
ncbi:hypothetical protein ASD76_11785 [Altererythrobacter sp. Root672]|nr:hypothetical protein ASD76_11785 [Altererythrobacter sp. Root672]